MSRYIRCPQCRSLAPALVVWAAGDQCPRCLAPLARVSRAGHDGPGGGQARFSRATADDPRPRSQEHPPGERVTPYLGSA